MAAAGDTTLKEDLLKGKKAGDTTFKVHLDGYNLLLAFKGGGAWPGMSLSTGPTTAASRHCATTTGK